MEKEKLSPLKELNTIKLVRGQRGSFGWEIKLVGEYDKEILKRLKLVNDEMVSSYDLNKTKEDK